MRRNDHNQGFTLIEALLAMTILAAAAAGILLPFASGASVQVEGARRTLAAGLASDLMEEIVATDYASILTWHGYTEAQGQVKDIASDPASPTFLPGAIYANYSRQATCQQVLPGMVMATVDVAYKGNVMVHIVTAICDQ